MKRVCPASEIKLRKSQDLQLRRFSHQEWHTSSQSITTFLDLNTKEQETQCFFKGAIFKCTCDNNGNFSQSQLALYYYLPKDADLDTFKTINLLIFPLHVKYDSFSLRDTINALKIIDYVHALV